MPHAAPFSPCHPPPYQARDWRIFREDNEIVTKGNMRHPGTGKQILPFRYWPESLMPEEVRGYTHHAHTWSGHTIETKRTYLPLARCWVPSRRQAMQSPRGCR